MAAAFGMGVGAVIFTTLLLLAWRLWQGAAAPLALAGGEMNHPNPAASFRTGLATQVTNPKTAIYYGSVFAALLPQDPPSWLIVALSPLVFVMEAGWYVLVAVLFSSGGPRAAYLRGKHWVDRAASVVIGLLGVRLVAG